jgi:DNA-binding transcriptional regulator/RsmH inhibitor MraZ
MNINLIERQIYVLQNANKSTDRIQIKFMATVEACTLDKQLWIYIYKLTQNTNAK